MKPLIVVIYFLFAISCNSTKDIVEKSDEIETTVCPKEGTCSFEVTKNKSLDIKYDEFGNSYPDIYDSNTVLLKFEYKRNEIEDTADSNYTEIIYAEIENDIENITLKDSELRTVKLAFARLCFCRGQTGYYNINNGTLSIEKLNDNHYQFKLEFKVDEVPQIITKISETFSL